MITHSQGTNIVDLLGIVKAKKLTHFLRIYIEEFWVCYRRLETNFNWRVGQLTNNQTELFSLLKYYELAKAAKNNNIQIFGDS